jgi:hypothetical protein
MAPRKLTKRQRALVCHDWISGGTNAELSKKYAVAVNTIKAVLKEHGLTRKDRDQKNTETSAQRKAVADMYARIEEGDLADPINACKWLFACAVVSARAVAVDPDYPGSAADRRKELASLSASAQKLLPVAEIHKVREQMRMDAEELEDGGGPVEVDVP